MRIKSVIFIIVLPLFLLLLFTWVGKEVVVDHRGTRSDFFAIWYGSNLIVNHTSPYSSEATQVIHTTLSGKPLGPGVYAHSFAYPAYMAISLLPLALVPYPTAFLIWTGIQLPMLFIALYLLTRFLEIELTHLGLILLFIAGSIGFLYPLVSYALGQSTIFLLFLLAATFFLVKKMKIIEAGILLAFTAIRPDIFIIASLTALVVIWGAKQSIKKLALTTITTLVAMNVATVFLLGYWYSDWINVLLKYSVNNPKTHWPLGMIPSTAISTGIVISLFTYLLWQFFQFTRKPTEKRKLLVISTMFLVHAIAFKITGSYQMALILIPALILLYLYTQYNYQWIIWLMFVSPWLLFGFTGRTDSAFGILFIPSAFLVLQAPLSGLVGKQTKTIETF